MHTVIRASLYVLRTDEGGRRGPIRSGYHAGVFLRPEQPRSGNDGVMTFEDRQWCFPGESCTVRIRFLCPELVQDVLRSGVPFELKEGPKVVARGTIEELLSSGSQ